MRILHIVPNYLPAMRYRGTIFAAHGLCKALAAMKHEVQVFTTNIDGPGICPVPIGTPVSIDGVQTAPLGPRPPSRTSARNYQFRYCASSFSFSVANVGRCARGQKCWYPLCSLPQGHASQGMIAGRSRLAKTAWISLVERSNIERAAIVHLTSHREATEIGRFGWQLSRVALIPNGIDEPVSCVGEVAADVQAIAAGQPLVLFLGRLSWLKGIDRLLHAFERTRSGILAIVGPDNENITPTQVKLAVELRIIDRVRIMPRLVIGHEKEYLCSSAPLFVLSSYSESFGNTVLEAMRRGVPVVVTPEVGSALIVRESGGGLVVSGESGPLSEAISRLILDPALARSMGAAGQLHAMQYKWSIIATQMEAMYQRLLSRSS